MRKTANGLLRKARALSRAAKTITRGTSPATQAEPAAIDYNDTGQSSDCWTKALSRLNEEQRGVVLEFTSSYARNSASHTIETSAWVKSLLVDCQVLQQQRTGERSKWKFEILGKSISIRELQEDVIATLVHMLDGIEKAAELATSVDPVHAVAPYLLVKALLAVSHSQYVSIGS